MARSTFMQKSQVGTGKGAQAFAIMQKNKAVKTVQEKNQQKVSVWVQELKMYVQVVPGTDLGPIIQRHKEMKKWRSKTLY